MSAEYESAINAAIRQGHWDAVFDEAQRWSEKSGCGPLPFFALNVVCMLRGDFAEAWKVYPKVFGEDADMHLVGKWVERLTSLMFCFLREFFIRNLVDWRMRWLVLRG